MRKCASLVARLVCSTVLLCSLQFEGAVLAQEPVPADPSGCEWMLPLIDDFTIVAAKIDLEQTQIPIAAVRLRSMVPAFSGTLDAWLTRALIAQRDLKEAGFSELAVIVSTSIGTDYWPVFAVPYAEHLNGEELLKLIPDAMLHRYRVTRKQDAWVISPDRLGEASSGPAVNSTDSVNRRRTLEAFIDLQKHGTVIVAFLSDDHKRVIEERHLQLPEGLGRGNASLWFNRIVSIACGLDIGRKVGIEYVLNLADGTEPEVVKAELEQVLNAAQVFFLQDDGLLLTQQVMELFQQSDGRISWALASDSSQFTELSKLVLPIVNQRSEDFVRKQTGSQMQSVMLGIFNHQSAFKLVPPAGGVAKANVTGALSWRVHLLPFLGQVELYQAFNLDEPWDSPHNRQFIPRMPAVFLLPNSKLTIDEGLSNICVPTGPNTMWPMDRLLGYGELEAGAATTIALLEVRDEQAQIWTQPCEMVVDPQRLRDILGGHVTDEGFQVTANGAMAYWPLSMAPEEFARRLTRDGKD